MSTIPRSDFKIYALILLSIILSIAYVYHRDESRIILKIANEAFNIEIADTVDSLRKGLSGLDRLGRNKGMLFIFPNDGILTFWMLDTKIPLSLVFIASDGTICEVYDMAPYSLDDVLSKGRYRYALELEQGALERAGATIGSRITLIKSTTKYSQLFR